MFLVTGGSDGPYWYEKLDSTETFDPLVGTWTASGAKLAQPMDGLNAETIHGRLFVFGINNDFTCNSWNIEHIIIAGGWYCFDDDALNFSCSSKDDILEYDPEEDTFTNVGHMTQARAYHAISVVNAGAYTKWCDGSM